MADVTAVTAEKKATILEALSNHPSYARAARKVRITRMTLWRWRRDDSAFAAECEQARELGMEALEDALIERGEKHDTTAAIFMLKGWKPDRYQEKRAVDLNVTGSLTIVIGERPDGPQ